jgi:RHS repeat-associated protein
VAGNKQYFHYDHIGNLVQTVNTSGEVIGDLFYTPYGEPLGGTMDQIDQYQPFGFSTKRSDFASGLVYFGYRFYVPYMERWLNRDPIGIDGGLNIYGYVENNPLIYVDPDGLRYRPSRGLGGGGTNSGAGGRYGQTIGNGYYNSNGRYVPPSIPVYRPPIKPLNISNILSNPNNNRKLEILRRSMELYGHSMEDKIKSQIKCQLDPFLCKNDESNNYCPKGN